MITINSNINALYGDGAGTTYYGTIKNDSSFNLHRIRNAELKDNPFKKATNNNVSVVLSNKSYIYLTYTSSNKYQLQVGDGDALVIKLDASTFDGLMSQGLNRYINQYTLDDIDEYGELNLGYTGTGGATALSYYENGLFLTYTGDTDDGNPVVVNSYSYAIYGDSYNG